MKITKYQHACLVIEKDTTTIVIDPGSFSKDFVLPNKVDAVIITHEHPDHLDESLMLKILEANPAATIFAHESIVGRFTNYTAIAAHINEPFVIGATSLRFFGGQHAEIASSIPVPANLAVLIDDHFYYPGDSFTLPENIQVKELALPVSAPWLKISEVMDFLVAIKPLFVFPTHDAILSDEGKALVDRILGGVAAGQNSQYKRLDGASIELS
ncbi:MAG: MBL fold metallo-hydrolase [Candidatus Microsaccharimonas sp.]